MSLPGWDFRYSPYAAAPASSSANGSGRVTGGCSRTLQLVEFDDSPHDIFRPERGRYPRLIHQHVERAEAAG